MLTLLLAHVFFTPLKMDDVSSAAQAALNQHHFYQVTGSSPDVIMHDVVVPAGAVIDGAGATIHVPADAKFGVQLSGVGAKARDLTMVCDTGDIFTNVGGKNKVDPRKIQGTLPTGIDCSQAGVRINDCSLSWFGTGIHSNAPKPEIMHGGETMIEGCNITNPISIGIDFEYPTDSLIRGCIVARDTAGVGDGSSDLGDADYGIKFYGAAGYITDCHVWGAFKVGVEVGASDAIVEGLTSEGARDALLRLTNWRIQVKNSFLYSPIKGKTVAVEAGTKQADGKGSAGQCHIDVRIGSIKDTDYKAIIQHTNDGQGNDYVITFDHPSGWPEPVKGAKDKLQIVLPAGS